MKLTKLHLFLILLAALILSSLGIKVLEGFNVIEGNTNADGTDGSENSDESENSDDANSARYGYDGNPSNSDPNANPFNNANNNDLSNIFDRERKTNEELEDSTTFNPDLRVTFQNSNANRSKLSYGAKDGITKDLIPSGEEHLYVLKSQIVPPVCPQCPKTEPSKGKGKDEKECPPCPRPERCPEPAFTCKKVPNYSAANVDSILPSTMTEGGLNGKGGLNGSGAGAGSGKAIPVLNSFAKFS